jgi:hypothetical protein
MKRPCRVPGCDNPISERYLMCSPCWRRVPKPMKRALRATYGDHVTSAHQSAALACLRAARETLKTDDDRAAELDKTAPRLFP